MGSELQASLSLHKSYTVETEMHSISLWTLSTAHHLNGVLKVWAQFQEQGKEKLYNLNPDCSWRQHWKMGDNFYHGSISSTKHLYSMYTSLRKETLALDALVLQCFKGQEKVVWRSVLSTAMTPSILYTSHKWVLTKLWTIFQEV